jgi:hypothetical protein
MPSDLKDLELDEVSLVGKAANGKRFLIYKSADKFKGRIKMKKMTKPAEADRAGAGASVTKADIEAIVNKAVAPLQEENAQLRKSLEAQSDILRKKEYVEIAKSDFAELGKPEETAEILKSLEGLPSAARKRILTTMKQASVMKTEAGKLLYHPLGSNRPEPGSATEQFESIVQKHLGEIRKSGTGGKSANVLRARAVTKAAEENPELAKAVMSEHKQNVHSTFIGGRR